MELEINPDPQPPIVEGHFFIKATAFCPECGNEQAVLIGRDKWVYHECNQGNVRMKVENPWE